MMTRDEIEESVFKTIVKKLQGNRELPNTFGTQVDFGIHIFDDHPEQHVEYVTFQMMRNISEEIIPFLFRDTGIYIKSDIEMWQAPYTDFDQVMRLKLRAKCDIVQAETRPVVIKYVNDFSEIPSEFKYCPYCSGHTKNDARGHCCACGGPRGGMS